MQMGEIPPDKMETLINDAIVFTLAISKDDPILSNISGEFRAFCIAAAAQGMMRVILQFQIGALLELVKTLREQPIIDLRIK